MKSKRYYYKLILRRYILPTLGYIVALYLKFVFKTSKVHIEKHSDTLKFIDGLEPALYAFWHGRLLMMVALHPPAYKMHILSSKNEITILVDYCVRQFGLSLIKGSARNPNKPGVNKGGSEALKKIIRTLKSGFPVGITPDGPLGPARKINPGILIASIISKKPIIPMTYTCSFGYKAKTWDKFMIPFPFGKLYFKINAPIYPPLTKDSEMLETFSLQLESVLNADMQELDKLVSL